MAVTDFFLVIYCKIILQQRPRVTFFLIFSSDFFCPFWPSLNVFVNVPCHKKHVLYVYIYILWRFMKDITYIRSHRLLVDTILSSALRPYDDSRYYEIWVIRWNFTTKLGVKPNESGPQDVLKSFLDDKSQLQQKIPTDFFLLENSKWIPELFGHFFVFGKILQGPWFSWKIPKFYSKLPTAFSTTPGWCEKVVRSGSSHRSTGGQFHGMAGVRSMGGWGF